MSWFSKLFNRKPDDDRGTPSRVQTERNKFAAEQMNAIKKLAKCELFYDSQGFSITLASPEGMKIQLNLHNAYDEYLSVNVDEREVVLERYARMILAMGATGALQFEDVKKMILPRVQERSFYEAMKLNLYLQNDSPPDPKEANFPYNSLADHLAVALVIDMPDSIRLVNEGILDRWKISLDQALTSGLENLRLLSEMPFEEVQKGLYVSGWRDNHDVARLLLTNKIREECLVKGDFVAFAPNRDHLIITGADEYDALTAALDVVERMANEPRPMHFIPLILKNDRWTLWQPSRAQHEYERLKELFVESQLSIYGENKELLDELYEKEEEDIFVGSFTALQSATGATVMTYCVWTEGVEALLPRAEKVVFVKLNEDQTKGIPLGACGFDRVLEVMKGLIEPSDLPYPERFKAWGFPNEDQFAELKLEPLP